MAKICRTRGFDYSSWEAGDGRCLDKRQWHQAHEACTAKGVPCRGNRDGKGGFAKFSGKVRDHCRYSFIAHGELDVVQRSREG